MSVFCILPFAHGGGGYGNGGFVILKASTNSIELADYYAWENEYPINFCDPSLCVDENFEELIKRYLPRSPQRYRLYKMWYPQFFNNNVKRLPQNVFLRDIFEFGAFPIPNQFSNGTTARNSAEIIQYGRKIKIAVDENLRFYPNDHLKDAWLSEDLPLEWLGNKIICTGRSRAIFSSDGDIQSSHHLGLPPGDAKIELLTFPCGLGADLIFSSGSATDVCWLKTGKIECPFFKAQINASLGASPSNAPVLRRNPSANGSTGWGIGYSNRLANLTEIQIKDAWWSGLIKNLQRDSNNSKFIGQLKAPTELKYKHGQIKLAPGPIEFDLLG